MPSDHSEVALTDVRVPDDAIVGEEGTGLAAALLFVHENRIRQAASSLGAAQFCVDRSVEYARERIVFGKPLAVNQAIQWPLVELHTECAMLRELIRDTAAQMDEQGGSGGLGPDLDVQLPRQPARVRGRRPGDPGPRRDRLHAHAPFEHIYRHHRRYRITEGSEEIQIRNIARSLFGFGGRSPGRTAVDGGARGRR